MLGQPLDRLIERCLPHSSVSGGEIAVKNSPRGDGIRGGFRSGLFVQEGEALGRDGYKRNVCLVCLGRRESRP